jgi:hypothetical protein
MLAPGGPVTGALGPPIVASSSGDCDLSDITFNSALYTLEIDPGTGLPFFLTSPLARLIRSIPVTSASGCVWDGGGNPPLSLNDYASMTIPAEAPPVPVQITIQ